ncbi:MAG: hypothetical protein JWP87_1006 [Labilithrix sp.]|nr:hypothetical protein [Labilithrix sp.]
MSSDYEKVADKVGLVPNVRRKDNVYQAAAVAGTTVIAAIVGLIYGGWPVGALAGALAGLVVSGFLSGLVLMIIGLGRK